MNNSLISVIIPTYNRAHLINDTLDSVLAQTYTNWECLIVDDGSTDNTKEVISEYINKDKRFNYLLNKRNKGAQGARNTGVLSSKGEFVIFFDSDDTMFDSFIFKLLEKQTYSECDIITCFSNVIVRNTIEIKSVFEWNSNGNIQDDLYCGKTYVDNNAALIRKSKLFDIDMLDEDCPSFQEWDTHLRLSKISNYATVNEILVNYYIGDADAISSNPIRIINGYLYLLKKHKVYWKNNHFNSYCNYGSVVYNLILSLDFKSSKVKINELFQTIPELKFQFFKQKIIIFLKKIKKMIVKDFFYYFYHLKVMIINILKKTLKRFGFQITKIKAVKANNSYIGAFETVQNAKNLNLSVTDYLEKIWNQQGDSKRLIFNLKKLGFFEENATLLEIGAGSGRYVEHIVKNFQPKVIYSYEIALDWCVYLNDEYKNVLISRNTNGFDLSFENDSTIDNLLAHGVFVYLPLLHTYKYFSEIVRVVNKNGLIAFDIYCDEDWNLDTIQTWSENGNHLYPVIINKQTVIDFFIKNNFRLINNFNKKHGQTFSTYLIFKKND